MLVLAGDGHPDISLAGGTKLSRLHNLGMAGVLAARSFTRSAPLGSDV